MRKTLLMLLLALIGGLGSQVSARWELGSQKGASDIRVGDTIVMEYCCNTAFLGRYLAGSKLTATGLIADENIYTVEQGPLDIRTGAPTVCLKQVAAGGYLTYNGSWKTISYSTDPANAANVQLVSCGQDIPWSNTYAWDQYQEGVFRPDAANTDEEVANWRKPGDGKLANDKSMAFSYSSDDSTFHYLGTWANADNIWFWQYTDANQWNVYDVKYILDLKGDLQELIDLCTTDGEYTGGTDPGFYQQDAADAYQQALSEALMVSVSGSDNEEFATAIANLKKAHAAVKEAAIPISEGYYYMVSAFEDYLNNFGVEKAAYANTTAMGLYFKTFSEDDGNFVFYLSPGDKENEWWVRHYYSGTYVGKPKDWYASNPPVTDDKEEVQNLRLRTVGKWFWGSRNQHSTSYTPTTSSASNNEGALTSWGQWSDEGTYTTHFNLWYLRRITDQARLDSFAKEKTQAELNRSLASLADEGTDLYGKLFNYTPDTSNPLLTVAGGGVNAEAIEGNQILFQKVRAQNYEKSDDYGFLIDNNDETYMQGRGYIELDISKTPQSIITFEYNTRCASGANGTGQQQQWGFNERPDKLTVYATNDTTSAGVWTQIATTRMGSLPLPARYSLDLGAQYGFLRFDIQDNATGGNYFTVSELQLYKSEVNKETSQYYTTEGLSACADKLVGMLPEMRRIAKSGLATQENVSSLEAAINEVKALYADTTELSLLIAKCEDLIADAVTGEEIGMLKDNALKEALRESVDYAKKNAFSTPMSVSAVRDATQAVTKAYNDFMAGLKTVEEGRWYFISNLDTERTGEAGAEDAYCAGNVIYVNSRKGGTKAVKWGFNDPASSTHNADNNPAAMWRFVRVDSTGYYAVQNLYTGYYLGSYDGDNAYMSVSEKPVAYEVAYAGNAGFTLYPRSGSNKKNFSLYPEGKDNDVICHETGSAACRWTFLEIAPEQQQAISISDFKFNLIDVMTLPYNISNLADYNDDVHTYAVRKITQETADDGQLMTTVELYEKNEFRAGEPCIIVLGSTAEDAGHEPYDLVIPFPSEIVDHTATFTANGLLGGLHSTKCAAGTAISSNKSFSAVGADGTTFSAQTGVIDLSTYKGEVEGVETALTLTISGLSPLPAADKEDVNGDGQINTSDVVAVFNYICDGETAGITLSQADVNKDGQVNTSDAVEIYNKILGEDAASKKYLHRILDFGKK